MNLLALSPAPAAHVLAAAHLMTWWAIIPASLCGVAYICRVCLSYKIASKALDKTPPAKIPETMTAITNTQPARPQQPRSPESPSP